MNKQVLKDFICYDIIASVFLFIPYNNTRFIFILTMLIFDLIHLYILERMEAKQWKN